MQQPLNSRQTVKRVKEGVGGEINEHYNRILLAESSYSQAAGEVDRIMREGGAVLCAILWAHMCTGLPTLERGGEAAVAAGFLGPPLHRAGGQEAGGVAQSGKLLQSMARGCCRGIRGGGEGKDKDRDKNAGGGDSEGGKASRMCAGSSKQLRAARQGLQGVGGRICQRPVLIKETNSTKSGGSTGGGRPSLGKVAAQRGEDVNSDPCTGSSTSSSKRGDGSAAGDPNLPKPKPTTPPKAPPSPPLHLRQNSNASTVGLRYWYDRKLKQWVIVSTPPRSQTRILCSSLFSLSLSHTHTHIHTTIILNLKS